ncbi:MAG: type II toxin-antitoxin system Phd/YefM family antitoxin [Thermodesulfobacteriota bacterium]|nr:type II toxin-antitoxin system Phd/YefM family antitoxin [Thermodesulfobacteriota bacterium]
METVSIAEAKSHLSQLIHQTESGEIIHLSRHGKPVAVLVSQKQYDRLAKAVDSPWKAIVKWRARASLQGDDFSDQEIDTWRDRTAERVFSWEE